MGDDRRLIEDYLPIQAISAEGAREKSASTISSLHLWWARRPLVACRAAVYGALVPVSRFVPNGASDDKKKSLGRANAAKFVKNLCTYPGAPVVIAEAQKHILEAHADRLTQETGKKVTAEDIQAGRAPRPKVLDMFAGGGAIPLEALRLGCEAYALDLNPVAHLIELCTLVYPQKHGKPDRKVKGSAEAGTWAGLADEVRHWGDWVLDQVKKEIGDLYPAIPDPDWKDKKGQHQKVHKQGNMAAETAEMVGGLLTPVAYLWTRTVTCKNPACKATVPLVRQTWLCKTERRYVALRVMAPKGAKRVRFEVVEATGPKGFSFDPEEGSARGNATCHFCGTVVDSDYVKAEGCASRIEQQLMAAVCTRPGARGRVYVSGDAVSRTLPDEAVLQKRIDALNKRTGLTVPSEPIEARMTGGICLPYGLTTFGQLFTPRQMLCLLTFTSAIRDVMHEMKRAGYSSETALAISTMLAAYLDRAADHWSSLCTWNPTGQKLQHTFARQALPMVWDFAEAAPWGGSVGDWVSFMENANYGMLEAESASCRAAVVSRGSATELPWSPLLFDAVITDPPYYDNVDYAKLSDFFYVWLKRSIGSLYPEHFASGGTPKKAEAVADPVRHDGSREKARQAYEGMMGQSFQEAHRVLKPGGQMVVVYAHKTTLGWSTLVDALRNAGFTVTEAWPLDTETKSRMVAMNTAALASSIFLVTRKRTEQGKGRYEDQVRPDLESIVRERVETLWDMGITGADLVIACVGAGLRAFTRYAKVEFANGEEVPATRFLTEVETVVLDTILGKLSKTVGDNGGRHSLAGVDPATRFYILWRYAYGTAELDAGEAIVFANGTHVELDGANSLTHGTRALAEKKKAKYRLLDYAQRGEEEKLGLPDDADNPAPLVDVLHRTLWLMERRPSLLPAFLRDARSNVELLRLVTQALGGHALKGGNKEEKGDVESPTGEKAALAKLAANWRSVVEDAVTTVATERKDRKAGQELLDFDKGGHR